jgi:hypothetical protein
LILAHYGAVVVASVVVAVPAVLEGSSDGTIEGASTMTVLVPVGVRAVLVYCEDSRESGIGFDKFGKARSPGGGVPWL